MNRKKKSKKIDIDKEFPPLACNARPSVAGACNTCPSNSGGVKPEIIPVKITILDRAKNGAIQLNSYPTLVENP